MISRSVSRCVVISLGVLALSARNPAQAPLDGVPVSCTDGSGSLLPQCAEAASTIGAIPRLPVIRPRGPAAAETDRAAPPRPAESARDETYPLQNPTEFQQFIAASTGRILPLFGVELFEKVPSTFAPVERVPVAANYVLGPGDELLVRVWGQVNLNLELTVDRSGAVFLPQVGTAAVAGLAFSQIQGYLRSQLERVYRNFDLSVTMGQLRSIQVFVVGQARRPGVYTVSALSTLVNALFACGGPSAQGSMRLVHLLRDGQAVTDFDIYALLLSGDRSHDARLQPGDVIHIGGTGPQAAIAGSVRRPAIYELRGEQTLADLIAMAGGLTPVADPRRVKIERVTEGSRTVLDLSADASGSATRLHNGDLVQVAAISASFANAVTLRGNVANPGRFAWRPGLSLRDILPDKESLVARAYWERHNQLAYTPVKYVPATEKMENPVELVPARFGPLAPAINWSYAVIERRKASDLSLQLVPFNLGRLVLGGDDAENHELQPGDVVTIFSQLDLRVPVSQQSRQMRLEGEFRAPGIYDIAEGETLGHLIDRVGGLTPDAYLYGAVFMRESARHDQQERTDQYLRDLERDLRNAAGRQQSLSGAEDAVLTNLRLEGVQRMIERARAMKPTGRIALGFTDADPSLAKLRDLPLEDGDRFMVPVRPVTVNVLGAVYNAGSLLYNDRWRVRDYLRRSGGCTRGGDSSRVFLIRADGTVVSRQDFGRFGPSFEMARVHPGDSIVVPESLPKTSVLSRLRDWSQISAQLALSGAVANVMR